MSTLFSICLCHPNLIKMKKLLIVTMFAVASFAHAQIGVNTTNPTKTLDINGEMRIRTTPLEGAIPATAIAVDDSGNVVRSNRLSLYDIVTLEAANSIRSSRLYGEVTVDTLDIGMSQTIVVPANKEAVIKVTYSIPMGTEVDDSPVSTYMGIRFLRNGIEAPAGSRKFSLPLVGDAIDNSFDSISKMNSIAALYTEILPASSVVRTLTYTLNGYIEQNDSDDEGVYIFNRFTQNTADENFNWGNANMTVELYIR